jgi:hypothetical protein
MINWTNDQATRMAPSSDEDARGVSAAASRKDGGTFWLVRTIGGTIRRPPIADYYTVRATTTTTERTPSGDASSRHQRLLIEADAVGIVQLERALRESGGVFSVESEPAPDGDYLDEGHSGVVTLRGGRIVED